MEIQKNILLSPFTTFHIGGPADYFVKVDTTDELIEAVLWARAKNTPFFILGSGANILVGDKGFRGLVIKNEANAISITGNHVTAESGTVMGDVIDQTAALGLSGLEHFAGIPSTVGGALWQNLHFLSPDRTKTVYIEEVLLRAEILSEEGERKEVGKEYFHFGYDYSMLHQRKDVVLSATFALSSKDVEEINVVIESNLSWRAEKHPEGAVWKSAGSVFKKIEGRGAGRLIQEVELKGHTIGGAQISEKHANFIVNNGTATAKDVKNLIELVQAKVKEQLNLEMIPEISLVGEF
ncbi:MAG TPA: UDP-N-acetylmuramate dehydrogenase [Candidatus Saccharimonadales bacterium]|nr:UDP-N-acetylmuramate dehydrogenase [Candidatus Saccharimonadales bacterium]